MIEIIPAIDIIGGKCVRLSQGDYDKKAVYSSSPVEMASRYKDCGIKRIHVVDLDGAKAGGPCNLDVLKEISALGDLDIEWGGGIKTREDLSAVFESGANHAIIGSVAVKQPELFRGWLREFGGERIVLGADVRHGKVSVSGWLEDSELSVTELVDMFVNDGLKEVIVTDITKDGMLQGPSDELYLELSRLYPGIVFTVSGGISSMDDIRRLDAAGLSRVIVGKAIYENRIRLEEIGGEGG